MAKRHFMAEALLRLADSVRLAPWQEELSELFLVVEVRPLSRVVREDKRNRSRVYEGWRSANIAAFLDVCSRTDGELWLRTSERLDVSGRRLVKAYPKKGDADRAYRQRHRDQLNNASRDRVAEWREAAKSEWRAYCDAYSARFPGTEPIGFGRWSRYHRSEWLRTGPSGLVINDVKGLRDPAGFGKGRTS